MLKKLRSKITGARRASPFVKDLPNNKVATITTADGVCVRLRVVSFAFLGVSYNVYDIATSRDQQCSHLLKYMYMYTLNVLCAILL